MFPFSSIPIDLPPIVLLHAVGLTLHGTRTVLQSPRTIRIRDSDDKHTPKREEGANPNPTTILVDDTLKGLLLVGIGLAYLITGAYVPAAQNIWLYASVPLRLFMAGAAGVRLCYYHYVLVPGSGRLARRQQAEARADMWMLVLADGVLGVVAGWVLGRFDGRLPGAAGW
ncbi:hypothetical protein SLS62_005208 [Diatrype stigma]|uniref:Uncharacterized protein n=1 Tax=Diatrype stigma TaxID=117547 RepID=A0AAN9UT29_9PEZI